MSYSLKDIYREIYHMDLGITFPKKPYRWQDAWKMLLETLVYLAKMPKDFLLYGLKKATPAIPPDKKIWLVISTKNNLDTLSFLEEKLAGAIIITTNKKIQSVSHRPRLTFHQASLYWFRCLSLLRSLWPDFGKALLLRFDIFIKGVGLYEASRRILQQHRPKALIFTNDHAAHPRALLWAAKSLAIPTVYIQHASVTASFPPLRYDLSLLEGRDSLDKYQAAGPVEGRVKLIGMPKFDPYFPRKNDRVKIRHIGVCTNMWDDIDRIQQLLSHLHERFPEITLSFRPHPGDTRTFQAPEGIRSSDSTRENIFDFLTRQDLIIAGDTSLHLEAALLNINSVYFPLNDYVSDVYGYVQKGLVVRMHRLEDLQDWIARRREQRPPVSPEVSYFNAVAGTEWEGRSQELAIRHIRELLVQ